MTLPHGAIPLTPDRLRELAVQWQEDARRVYESDNWKIAAPGFYENARRCFAEWLEATR